MSISKKSLQKVKNLSLVQQKMASCCDSIYLFKAQLQVVWCRFTTILNLHISTISNLYNQCDIFMCKIYSAKYFNSLVLNSGMQGVLIYQKMFKKDSNGVVQMKYGRRKNNLYQKINRSNVKGYNVNGNEYGDVKLMETVINDENEYSTNVTFHFEGAYHMALKFGVGFFAFSSAISVLMIAFLPLLFALFCISVPVAIVSEVVGVLTIAILQSFNPFYQNQTKQKRIRKVA